MHFEYITSNRFLQIMYMLKTHAMVFATFATLCAHSARSKLLRLTLKYHPDKCPNQEQNYLVLMSFIQWWDEQIGGKRGQPGIAEKIEKEYHTHLFGPTLLLQHQPHPSESVGRQPPRPDNRQLKTEPCKPEPPTQEFNATVNATKQERGAVLKEDMKNCKLDKAHKRVYNKIVDYIKNVERLQENDPDDDLFTKFPKLLVHPVGWKPDAIVRVENCERVRSNYLVYSDIRYAHFSLDEYVKWIVLRSEEDLQVGNQKYTPFMWFKNMLGAERVNTRTRRVFWG